MAKRLAGGVAIIDKSRMPLKAMFNVLGIGVAVSVRISTSERKDLNFSFGHGIIENGTIFLSVGIISLDGQEILRVEQEGLIENPIELGERAAQELLNLGGDKILKEIKEKL